MIFHGPPARPETSVVSASRWRASARSSSTTIPSPFPSWMAPGQFTAIPKLSPASGTSA